MTPKSNAGRFLRQNAAIIFPALIFFAIVVLINWRLFVIPTLEIGDVAVNAIQVQNAKHFHELLGNYSRWHFHHPGPFFMYLFAAGEAIFYDISHLVPAPVNGEELIQIAFNTACLFGAIYIFDLNLKQPLFPMLAVLSSVLFLYAAETAIPSSALVSLWPPYTTLFCFLLLAVASASVSAGNWKHLPVLAITGMILIHAHTSQLLFVVVLTATALSSLIIRDYRDENLLRSFRLARAYIAAALGIIALFLLPIGLDSLIHHPSNISQIQAYLRQHAGEHNSLSTTLLYVFSFFTFYTNPDIVLASPSPKLSDLLNPHPFVLFYWSIFLFLGLLGVILHFGKRRRTPVFLKFVLFNSVVIILLFGYWSWRITGPMYTFNGYFFFSVQLLLLFALSAFISQALRWGLERYQRVALTCACTAPLLLVPGLDDPAFTDPDVSSIVSVLHRKHVENIAMTMPIATEMLLPGAGIASIWQRSGGHFCVEPQWDFVYGSAHVCKNNNAFYRLSLSGNRSPCNLPCAVVYQRSGLYVTGTPGRSVLNPPMLITASDTTVDLSAFNGREQDGVWSKKESAIAFRIGPQTENLSPYNLTITGVSFKGRPVTVKLNGHVLGPFSKVGRSRQVFELSSQQLVWGGINSISFDVPKAGPIGADSRELGYRFEELLLSGERPPKGKMFSEAAIAAVPETYAGSPMSNLAWQHDGGWAVDGFYPDIGRLNEGTMWGSWGHNDALTGKLSSSAFSTDPLYCVIVPVGHGPSPAGQRVALTAIDGQIIAEIPLDGTDANWQLFEIYYDHHVDKIKILAEDNGTGFGQWLAVGQPRFCR